MTAGRGRLGIGVIEISPELRAHFGAPNDRGVLVDRVAPDQPAARAGVRVGDIVLDVDGGAVGSASDILDAMSDRKKGEQVGIAVLRAGKRMQLTATLDSEAGPRMRRMMPKDLNWNFALPQSHDRAIQRELDETRKRLEELERRLDQLDRT